MNSSRKKLNGSLAYQVSKRIKGLQLAHAFKLLKSNGLVIRVVTNCKQKDSSEKDLTRVNVQVENGRVVMYWVG